MRFKLYLLLIAVLIITAGCSAQEDSGETEVSVSAAASLSDVLSELKSAFESEYPDTTLALHYGASGKLSQQIQQGAPVDVFLSADQKWMDQLAENEMLSPDTRMNFAKNRLVLASAQSTSFSIESMSDLSQLNFNQMAMGNPESVPAGDYAEQAMQESHVWDALEDRLVYTNDARQALTYIESENTEIGFVYASYLERSDLIKNLLTVDDGLHDPIQYPAAVIASSNVKDNAAEFIEFLKTDEAQKILEKYGFES